MNIRDKISKSPALGIGLGAAMLVLAGYVIFQTVFSSTSGQLKALYSDDDGKTWFSDEFRKLPPFDHRGKLAYRAQVFKCANGKMFVGWLEAYSDDDRKALTAAGTDDFALAAAMITAHLKVKRPSETGWVGSGDAKKYEEITTPKCPDGSMDTPTRVNPN